MPSSPETWLRRLHTYAGLYFLIFIWLFGASGLILNHPRWPVAEFWAERQQVSRDRQISVAADDDLSVARAVISELDIRGEISGKVTRTSSEDLRFRVVRPGDIYDIRVDKPRQIAEVNHTRVNRWGVLNMLHSFTGVRRNDHALHQNWWATGLWRFSMDALSFGLGFMVLSGIYIWYSRGQRRLGGAFALLAGIAAVTAFLLSL